MAVFLSCLYLTLSLSVEPSHSPEDAVRDGVHELVGEPASRKLHAEADRADGGRHGKGTDILQLESGAQQENVSGKRF